MTPPPPFPTKSEEKIYFVYLLQSLKDKKFYLGWTSDLEKRIQEHNEGLTISTKGRRPFKLVGYESYSDLNEAKIRERKLRKNPHMYSCFKKRAINGYMNKSRSPRERKEVVG